MLRLSQNTVSQNSIYIYVDMNSFFASCEQQDHPELRNKPIGVVTHNSPYACVIAPSIEAKKFGVKTGMRLNECKQLCPHLIPTTSNPYRYRWYHVQIMNVLHQYSDDVLPKSIDEAVVNFTAYRWVYKDFIALAKQIKEGIRKACGDYVKCSIGIAPNTFLAKVATDLQKPDGLIQITPDNIDDYLAGMELTDLPGIAAANAKRLHMIGIKTPLQLRHSTESLLRKAFGGVVGSYWHRRLHFKETDFYSNHYRSMSATRTVSSEQRISKQKLESLFISICTRLEQRMVKQEVFCKEASFFIRYKNQTRWETKVRFGAPLQDAVEMRNYLMQKITDYEQAHQTTIFNNQTLQMSVGIGHFTCAEGITYSLFDNRMNKDKVRKVMYILKDKYGRDIVRKASETISPKEMKDAIGFGSVKDLYQHGDDAHFNQYLMEEE